MIDENSFHPAFLASLSEFELVVLQHDLRQFPEDRAHLDAVLAELATRAKVGSVSVSAGDASSNTGQERSAMKKESTP